MTGAVRLMMLPSPLVLPSLTGYISKGIALGRKKQVWDTIRAFDLASMFTNRDLNANHLLLLIKVDQHNEALLHVQELANALNMWLLWNADHHYWYSCIADMPQHSEHHTKLQGCVQCADPLDESSKELNNVRLAVNANSPLACNGCNAPHLPVKTHEDLEASPHHPSQVVIPTESTSVSIGVQQTVSQT
ncbi:uncharacterized protein F5147DRAFT_659671 [Suillus discolor]|uniref:Uncharacterized protein n=1 Tax=Suillus discolor TaxID=1912936 RepID=A0A9P7ER34_9AGAM|nr:uncharacterized protein F5147DRAFT_659671 [Suillus discolor]KAG2085009.1 hypothetical protein F5147DRAFT_659671 [Suillus discolor]